MSDTDSSARFGGNLVSSSSIVTLTAAVFGIGAAYATQAWTAGSVLGFGALLGVGVGVPTLYREWDVRASTRAAFAWAVVASAIACGFYAVVFVALTRLGVNGGLGDGLAGGATVGVGIVFSLYRGRAGS